MVLCLCVIFYSYIPFQQTIKKGAVGKLETKKKIEDWGENEERKEGVVEKQRNWMPRSISHNLTKWEIERNGTIWTAERNEGKAFLGIHGGFPVVDVVLFYKVQPCLGSGKGTGKGG